MYHAACKAADSIVAQAVIMVLFCVISSVGEHHGNKRHAHSQWNKVSIEDIEVDIFRVIYGSLWIISICTWSTSSAHFMHVFLCVLNLFPFYSTELLSEYSLSTDWFGWQNDSCYFKTSRWPMLRNGSHLLLARRFFLLIMDNTAKVTEMIHAATGDHSNYQHFE